MNPFPVFLLFKSTSHLSFFFSRVDLLDSYRIGPWTLLFFKPPVRTLLCVYYWRRFFFPFTPFCHDCNAR
jgi:hypothetical protein